MIVATNFVVVESGLGPLRPNNPANKKAISRLKTRCPEFVVTSMNAEFLSDGILQHGRTCFILDRGHDWTYDAETGLFRMCTKTPSFALVFEYETVTFCASCGSRMPCKNCN